MNMEFTNQELNLISEALNIFAGQREQGALTALRERRTEAAMTAIVNADQAVELLKRIEAYAKPKVNSWE